MATSTIFNFNFNNSEIVDSTGQWYNATTGTPTTEFIEHDGNTALLQRAYVAETSYTRDINPVFLQSRDPTFTAHTYTIELQIYPLRDSGGFGPWDGPVLEFNTESDARGWVSLVSVQRASISNTFYWHEYGLGPDGTGIPFLTVTAADGTYNRWYSIRIERVDDGTNTGATIKIYVDGTLVVNETLTYPQDARIGRIGDSIRYTYRRNSTSPEGAGVAIDNFKLTAGIAPSSVVDVSLANLQRNNANLLSFIKGKVPAVNDGTLTIQKNGTNVATFTANQSTAATANITVPTAVSELTNDSGYLTSSSNLDASKLTSGTVDIARLPQGALERLVKVANEAARYALTTADVQLGDTVQQLDTGIMYIVTDDDHLDSAAGYTEYTAGTAASVPWSGVTGKPTFAAVATSGAYSDLTGTPTFAAVATSGAYSDLTGKPTFAAVATSGAYSDLTGTPTIPTVNNATLTIQQNGTNVATFSANSSSNVTANITVPTTLESLSTNSIPFHNAYPRCKYLGNSITNAQNTAIKNRTYDNLFIGDYWTINGVNWRIVAIDYYYNVGDTNFDKGNVIVMPDTVLYNAQMNTENTTSGAYAGSLMRTQNLNSARTIAQNAFGSHLANHRILLASAVDSSGPSNWDWYDSDGVKLPNEVQIYGTRVWGSALKGFDVGTQKQQFPLMLFAPQFVNIRQDYWLQDVSSNSVSRHFARVNRHGYADSYDASHSSGVRPSFTLSYI